jgi:hypothetical protein
MMAKSPFCRFRATVEEAQALLLKFKRRMRSMMPAGADVSRLDRIEAQMTWQASSTLGLQRIPNNIANCLGIGSIPLMHSCLDPRSVAHARSGPAIRHRPKNLCGMIRTRW